MSGTGSAPGSSRYRRWSAQSVNHTTPSRTHQAAPPYSWTAVRALRPSGSSSSVPPSARRRTSCVRPPSAGRPSAQTTSVAVVWAVHPHLAEADGRGHDDLGRHRGGPRAEGALDGAVGLRDRLDHHGCNANGDQPRGRVTCAGRSRERGRPGAGPAAGPARAAPARAHAEVPGDRAVGARRDRPPECDSAVAAAGRSRMCRAQVRVAARARPHRYAQQARQVARDSRADTARRVVDDEHLPDAASVTPTP